MIEIRCCGHTLAGNRCKNSRYVFFSGVFTEPLPDWFCHAHVDQWVKAKASA